MMKTGSLFANLPSIEETTSRVLLAADSEVLLGLLSIEKGNELPRLKTVGNDWGSLTKRDLIFQEQFIHGKTRVRPSAVWFGTIKSVKLESSNLLCAICLEITNPLKIYVIGGNNNIQATHLALGKTIVYVRKNNELDLGRRNVAEIISFSKEQANTVQSACTSGIRSEPIEQKQGLFSMRVNLETFVYARMHSDPRLRL